MRRLLLAALLLPAALPARAGLLSGQGVFVLDQTGAQRPSFSNNERVVLQQKVFNSVASANRLAFRFFILGPTGAQVFQHVGNAVVGSIGNAASQVSGIPVAQFYTGPGFYTFRAETELDGQIVSQSTQFSVSSPNILLIYPPNGARNMSDVPLTFRWSASGASRYRVTVGDNPSMYNSIFNQETGGGENFLSYPQNPSDPRQRMTAGQVYYWIVEGLDASGNVIAQSETPFNFSVNATALAKDLAVTDLTIDSAIGADGVVQLRVRVFNQGNTTENSVNLRIGVGGLPAQGTPISVTLLNPGEAREWTVSGAIPVDQQQTLATACLELFDDNVPNNCKTLAVTRPEAGTQAPTTIGGTPLLSVDQMWEMLGELLRERGIDLSEWEMDGSMDSAELAALIDGLRQGSVQVTLSGAPVATGGSVGGGVIGSVTETKKEVPLFGGGEGIASVADNEDKPSVEQLWNELADTMRNLGVDLNEWEFTDKMEPEELEALVAGIKDGTIRAFVTGGAPTTGQVLGTPGAVGSATGKSKDASIFEPERAKVNTDEEEEEFTPEKQEKLWKELNDQLRAMGVDLTEWEFTDKMDPKELEGLVAAIKEGGKAYVTGGEPTTSQILGAASTGGTTSSSKSKDKTLEDLLGDGGGEKAKVEQPAQDEDLGEWVGMAGPAGKNPFTMAIKDADDWSKRWKRLREGKAPQIEFKTSIVVGIVAGSMDKGERVEIENVQVGTDGLVVRYRLVSQTLAAAKDVENGKTRARVPYILKQVQASPALDVRFERAEDGGER
ncbi:MAG: hypothetical protein HY925_11175 [Elusimicrobia bacterium]|nr:hypothetical protein [Elusimicrobiota bacterium]